MNWVVELDHSVDPEVPANEIASRLENEIGEGRFVRSESNLRMLLTANEAMTVLFQFSDHVVSIEQV